MKLRFAAALLSELLLENIHQGFPTGPDPTLAHAYSEVTLLIKHSFHSVTVCVWRNCFGF